MLLKDAMHIHKKRVSDDLKPFHAHLEQRFTSWIKMIESEYNLQVIVCLFVLRFNVPVNNYSRSETIPCPSGTEVYELDQDD